MIFRKKLQLYTNIYNKYTKNKITHSIWSETEIIQFS